MSISQASPSETSFWFSDSGVGSLIFLYNAYPRLNEGLKALQAQYDIPPFRLDQLAEMEPAFTFSDRVERGDEPRIFCNNVLSYSLEQGARASVLACNIVSAEVDAPMLESFASSNPQQTIVPIIEDSAKALYDASTVDADGVRTIGIFSTFDVINAGTYQRQLEEIHRRSGNQDQLKIITSGPDGWADGIDAGATPEELRPQIRDGVAEMVAQGGNNQTVYGLFCTHFPMLQQEITEEFQAQGVSSPTFITQGDIFARKLLDMAERDIATGLANGSITRRDPPLNTDDIADVPITSHVTGGAQNIGVARQVAATVNPVLAERTLFEETSPDRTNMTAIYPEIAGASGGLGTPGNAGHAVQAGRLQDEQREGGAARG